MIPLHSTIHLGGNGADVDDGVDVDDDDGWV